MNSSSIFLGKRPRYQQIAESLLASIERGDYPVGTTLPTEAQICEQFDVSRHTVREALRSLSQMGIVTSHHGIGTQVTSNRISERYVQTLKSITDLWQYVKDTRREQLDLRDVMAAEVDAPMPGRSSQVWRMLEGIRVVEGRDEPVAWTQVFLLPRYAAVFDEIKEEVLVYSLVEKRFAITTQSVRQTITAVQIDARVAKLLAVKPGSCGLAAMREYVSSTGEIYEVTWSIHPADRYKYSMEIFLSHGPN